MFSFTPKLLLLSSLVLFYCLLTFTTKPVSATCCRGFKKLTKADMDRLRSSGSLDGQSREEDEDNSLQLSEEYQSDQGTEKRSRRSSRESEMTGNGLTPGSNSEEDPDAELSIRLEFIKRQILRKLGMNKAPRVKRGAVDNSLYQPLLELQIQLLSTPTPSGLDGSGSSPLSDATNQDQQHQQSTTNPAVASEDSDKLFIFPFKQSPYGSTFNVSINSSRSPYPIRKISLLVKWQVATVEGLDDDELTLLSTHTTVDGSVVRERVINVVRPESKASTNQKSNQMNFQKRSGDNNLGDSSSENQLPSSSSRMTWKEYNITEALFQSGILSSESEAVRPLLLIASKSRKIYSSFITVEYDHTVTTRSKRSVDCSSAGNSSSCCREQFYVNFTHIGWDNWIIQPTGYYANYCKGKCDISHARYHHTTVVQKYQSLINLCCSPREMSHIPLIYIDEGGFVLKKVLLNMVVESCDCA